MDLARVAECRILRCLIALGGSAAAHDAAAPEMEGRPAADATSSLLLASAMSGKGDTNKRHRRLICRQWQLLCATRLGSIVLWTALLSTCPNLADLIFDIEDPGEREAFLALSGVARFLRDPRSVGGWLEARFAEGRGRSAGAI